jgi:diguanylate cyclase
MVKAPMPSQQASTYSDRAIQMMRSLHVQPTPKNYAVFFACAAGQPGDLVRELESIIEQKQPLNDELLDRLYNNFIAEQQSRAVHDTAQQAKKILAEMLASVGRFSGDTQNVSQDMARQLEQLDDGQVTEESLRLMMQTVISSASVMRQSSDTVSERLASAQQEISDLRENLAKATTESERDFLTGCYNRKAFDKRLQEAAEEASLKEYELTLVMLDIDHFKRFNDSFGHLIGDEVLKIVAKALTDSVKGMDTVARFGGEEFAVILPRTPIGGGMIVAEGIRKAIAGKELKNKSTGMYYGELTVSLGVAAFRHHHDSPQNMIRRADEALYRSKKGGRNRVTQENLSE